VALVQGAAAVGGGSVGTTPSRAAAVPNDEASK
jgi:hypothetical protein